MTTVSNALIPKNHRTEPVYSLPMDDRLSLLKILPFKEQVCIRLASAWGMSHKQVIHLRGNLQFLDRFQNLTTSEACTTLILSQTGKSGNPVILRSLNEEASEKFFTGNRDLLTSADEAMVKACWGEVSAERRAVIQTYWKMVEKDGPEIHMACKSEFTTSLTNLILDHHQEMCEIRNREFSESADYLQPKIMVSFASPYVEILERKFALQCKQLQAKGTLLDLEEQRVVFHYWMLQ